MKVTKDMLDKGLRSSYGKQRPLIFLLTRKWGIGIINFMLRILKGRSIKGIESEERYISSNNEGPDIRIRIFRPLNHDGVLPALLYFHGGGYVIGNPEIALEQIKYFIEKRPCVVIAPDYRNAVNNPFPAGFNDCYDTLLWAKANAKELSILPENLIIAGHSAGGGMTAAVTLKARDTQDVDIAFQMPIYPMIDDRQTTPSARAMDVHAWNSKSNKVAWDFYLRDLKKTGIEIPAYAAPTRNSNYSDFPPTITFVGELEPFKDETIAYVEALKKAEIPVEFKMYNGCYHGFEALAPKADISKNALRFTYDMFAKYYDEYVA